MSIQDLQALVGARDPERLRQRLAQRRNDEGQNPEQGQQRKQEQHALHRTSTRVAALRPKVSGSYISSALVGGTTKVPMLVARAR